jgi:catechol 2,3-dioxygenase-like lactoylglutathione lyase family enzyme
VSIVLNHTIVPSRNKEGSAKMFARIFGLDYAGPVGHFAQVRVNDSLSFDWDNRETFESHHYAFFISDEEFDAIFDRIKAEPLSYGSEPYAPDNGQINTRRGGRGLYFRDPDGHLLEIMTRPE